MPKLEEGGIRRKKHFELHREWALNAGGVKGVAARHIQDVYWVLHHLSRLANVFQDARQQGALGAMARSVNSNSTAGHT